MQIVRVPGWSWPSYSGAEYFGRRHSLMIGPFLILYGQMTDAEIMRWDALRSGASDD